MYWNVFYANPNGDIDIWNIFKHKTFYEEVKTALTLADKEEFTRQLHKIVKYYFWAKNEYEITISSWPSYITRFESQIIKSKDLPQYRLIVNVEGSEKFSIYDQIELNWDVFVDYCWRFKK